MDDDQLMRQIALGDKAAFTEFATRHIKKIVEFAMRYMRNRDDAEDIAQEAFTRLWTKASQWQARGVAPRSWLYRISYNLCIDALRKQKSRMNVVADINQSMEIAEETQQQEMQHSAVVQALNALPERQHTAILLCTYQGLSNREAAESMEISVDALESLLSRARRKLREQLIQQNETES
jgi:RNA polymerase sigma-70 factor (ECF subfamily)